MATNAPLATTTETPARPDARALGIVAKTIYRELRQSGLREEDVMTVAGELLSLVTGEVRERRNDRR